jgi:hypothetical protein
MTPIRQVAQRILHSTVLWRLLPTATTYYFNRQPQLQDPQDPPHFPDTDWSRHERRQLLNASEDRLRNLEGKGPGVATVSAVVGAGTLTAMTLGWDFSTLIGRFLLVVAAVYAALSICMPLYLVGPLMRNTVRATEVAEAAEADNPEEALAQTAERAAAENDLRNIRISNMLDASRRELAYSLILLIVWAVLVPLTTLLKR